MLEALGHRGAQALVRTTLPCSQNQRVLRKGALTDRPIGGGSIDRKQFHSSTLERFLSSPISRGNAQSSSSEHLNIGNGGKICNE